MSLYLRTINRLSLREHDARVRGALHALDAARGVYAEIRALRPSGPILRAARRLFGGVERRYLDALREGVGR